MSKGPITRYWRDPRIDEGCVSERGDLREEAGGLSFSESVLDTLIGCAVPISAAHIAAESIEGLIDQEARRRAGEAFRLIASKLEGSAAAVALRRVLLGDDSQSQREAAAEAGCSRAAIVKQEAKIRQRIGGGVQLPA